MATTRITFFLVSFSLFLIFLGFVAVEYSNAQDDIAVDETCVTMVQTALELVESTCEVTGRNQACYGHPMTDVEPRPDVDIVFITPGDLAELREITRLHTNPLNADIGDWGIAVLKVQADLPDTLPGQNVTFLLTGDVTLTDASEDTAASAMQNFYFTTGIGESDCEATPDSLVIQSPSGTQVTLSVNGVDVELGSTVTLFAMPNQELEILVLGGEAEVTAIGATENVPAGQFTVIELGSDEGLIAIGTPSTPQDFDPARIQGIPLNLLPEAVAVSSASPWTGTGITVNTGQKFFISVSGFTNVCGTGDNPNCVDDPNINRWVGPEGNLSFEICEGQYGDCPLIPGAYAALVGRIGNNESFLVGSGGSFTATASGELELGYNDHRYDDNAGAYSVIVTVEGTSVEPEPAELQKCIVRATNTVNLRVGPGTDFSASGTMSAGESVEVNGQNTDSGGFVWWRLTTGEWVRSDVVGETGDCEQMPIVP